MKMSIIAGLMALVHVFLTQKVNEEQEQINKDVWYNFMQAYHDLDASLFNQIHTDDVIRVIADQESMLIGSEYKDRNLEVFNRWNSQKLEQRISFSFISRSIKENWAYEIGIYKLTRFNQLGEPQEYYGKFNVTLQKTEGTWKIKIDADTNENGTVDQNAYDKGDILFFFGE